MPLPIPAKALEDFFISYTSSDRAWAEWIAWELEAAGYSTVLQAWDFKPGSNFVIDMHVAAARAQRTIIILSANYLQSVYTQSEWAAAFAGDPLGKSGKLLPVRVSACEPGGILGQVVFIDLVGMDEAAALERLVMSVGMGTGRRGKPDTAPSFPGAGVPLAERSPSSPPDMPPQEKVSANGGRRRHFVHAQITSHGLFDIARAASPYAAGRDATDPFEDGQRPSSVSAFVWLPTSEYVRTSPVHAFTPIAAICVTESKRAAERLRTALDVRTALKKHVPEAAKDSVEIVGLDKRDIPPSRMRNEEKEDALIAVAAALQDSFVAAVAVPDLVICAARRQPKVAYQAMIDLFLLPLVETHRRLDFEQFHVRLTSVGDATPLVIGMAKKALKAAYTRRDCTSVSVVEPGEGDVNTLLWGARVVAWAVGAYYNSGNPKWVSVLDRALNGAQEATDTPST